MNVLRRGSGLRAFFFGKKIATVTTSGGWTQLRGVGANSGVVKPNSALGRPSMVLYVCRYMDAATWLMETPPPSALRLSRFLQ